MNYKCIRPHLKYLLWIEYTHMQTVLNYVLFVKEQSKIIYIKSPIDVLHAIYKQNMQRPKLNLCLKTPLCYIYMIIAYTV